MKKIGRAVKTGLRKLSLARISGSIALLCSLLSLGLAAYGQSVAPRGDIEKIIGSGFTTPVRVDMDAAGNLYISDTGNGNIQKITPSGVQTTLAVTGVTYPEGVAFDSQGNIYICDYYLTSIIKLTPQGVQSTIGSGLSNPFGIASDSLGNLYVADFGNDRVVKITQGGTVTPIGTNLNYPTAVRTDAANNLYIADTYNNQVVKVTPGGTQTVVASSTDLSIPQGLAVDSKGNVFVANTLNSTIQLYPPDGVQDYVYSSENYPADVFVDPTEKVYVANSGGGDVEVSQAFYVKFGSVAVGSSATDSFTYAITANGTLGTPKILTFGAAGKDFKAATNNSNTQPCTGGVTTTQIYCQVDLSFTPLAPGLRQGAIEIVDGSGNVLATTYIYGIGTGPEISFGPGKQSSLVSVSGQANAITVDGSGDVFMAESGGIVSELAAGASTKTTVISGLSNPKGIVVDGAGNLFVSDTGNSQILKISNGTSSVIANASSLGVGSFTPVGLSLDGAGDLYFADQANGYVWKLSLYGGPAVTVATGISGIVGVVVDGTGNLYIATSSTVYELPNGGSQVNIASGLSGVAGIAVDAAGDVFITSSTGLSEVPAGGSSQSLSSASAGYGVAVDAVGDIYFGQSSALQVLPRGLTPTLSFAPTNIGSTSSDSPQALIPANIGNANLTFSAITFGANFVQVAGSGTPPDCTSSTALAPGKSCDISISFKPTGSGTTSTLTLTDNSLNGSPASQVVTLNGTSPAPVTGTALVTGQTPGPLRNNYTGFVGMEFTVGSTPLTVSSLGRYVVAGNTASHAVKLVQANGTDVPGASVSVVTSGAAAGQYKYTALAASVTLLANTSYFLVSQETAGGDQWYDYGPVSVGAGIATVLGPTYQGGNGAYVPVTTLGGDSYVPVNLLYTTATVTPVTVSITSPTNNATVSGTISVTVSTTGPVTSLQLQVDGVNSGSPVASGPISLNTNTLSNGTHSLTVVASGGSSPVTSSPVSVTVSNVAVSGNSFVLSSSPGASRNNYTGYVGMQFTVGSTPVTVTTLGRFVIAGDSGNHIVKLVSSGGTDVPGGSVTVNTAGAAAGQFLYATLASPVVLSASTSYFLVSQETAGGDQWYDLGPVTTSVVGSVVGPTYTDGSGHYVTVAGYTGYSYVPVSFQYSSSASTPVTVSITSPANNATVSGIISVAVSTTGPVTSLQLQVDGVNSGSPVSSSPLSLNTTTLSNGTHSLTVVASGGSSPVTSSPVSVTVSNSTGGGGNSFVLSSSPGSPRNNYTGFVGMQFTVGSTPVTVTTLGRYVVSGDAAMHVVKLVSGSGTDVPGGSVTVNTAGAPAGQFLYATLASPVVLSASTSYFLVSQETAGGDLWDDLGPVTTSVVASVVGPTYTDGGGHYVTVGGYTGYSYVPVSFQYSGSSSTPVTVSITSPANNATVSGNISVTVSTTGPVTSLQLQVDGVNSGSPVSASPISLNTTTLSNGTHSLTVVASGGSSPVTSSPVSVTVSNTNTLTAFTTGETASTLRNNYAGFVGLTLKVGASPLTIKTLGRYVVSGNSGSHLLQLVQANGTPVTGGSVTVNTSGATAGQFLYGTLASPVTLAANTTYFLVSQETAGGDNWYNLEPITTTSVASVTGPAYTDGGGNYVTVGGYVGYSYVPLSFQY